MGQLVDKICKNCKRIFKTRDSKKDFCDLKCEEYYKDGIQVNYKEDKQMSDRFTFEYNDGRNDIKVKLIINVTELAQRKTGTKTQGMAVFQTGSEIWYKGKKYEPKEFQDFSKSKNFKFDLDFGFGGAFNFFCAGILEGIQQMAIGNKNKPPFIN